MSTWILLRGLTRERRHWGAFPQQLAEALPGAEVHGLELPGNGELNGLDSPARIAGMVAHCQQEVVRLNLMPPFHLLAMSMGAMVAVAWAKACPTDIAACVLINTSFGGFSPPQQRLRPRAWPHLLRFLLTRSAEQRERIVFRLTSRMAPDEPVVVAGWVALRKSHPVRLKNALRQILASARFQAPAAAPVPTLVLSGAGDHLVVPQCSQEIAQRWGCALSVHPEAGHDLPLDDGDWVARQVRAWLLSVPGPTA